MNSSDEELKKIDWWIKHVKKTLRTKEDDRSNGAARAYFWRNRKRGKLPRKYGYWNKEIYHHCGELISNFKVTKGGYRYCARCLKLNVERYRARKKLLRRSK